MLSTHPWALWPGLVFIGKPTEERPKATADVFFFNCIRALARVAAIQRACRAADAGPARMMMGTSVPADAQRQHGRIYTYVNTCDRTDL